MLEKIDLTKSVSKEEYQEQMPLLCERLAALQRTYQEEKIPLMIVFEGLDASGKGLQTGKLIQCFDPRGFEVYAIKKETKEEQMHPYLWRFWTKTPSKGRISIFDGSWYRRVSIDRFDGKIKGKKLLQAFESIASFEQQLTADGTILIKLFLHISKEEQQKRLMKLRASKETKWRVKKADLARLKNYTSYLEEVEEMLRRTDTGAARWHIVEATDRRYATLKIYTTVIQVMEEGLERKRREKQLTKLQSDEAKEERSLPQESVLGQCDLSKSLSKEVYQKRLKELQSKMERLHAELYRKRIPVVIGFEGWDAGGKGGAIKRLTEKMDPRGFVVHPTASPNEIERNHHYLWRFWRVMPKAGHIAIFDRTWYGRVMVERVEQFCSRQEWQRAYKEINDMEKDLVHAGCIVLKFWMQIDKDEQKRRFTARQEDPRKTWKITDEDWRNREKWEQYETAVNEMLIRTSTEDAPWIVVEGNDKYYARIRVLECVVDAIESHLSQNSSKK